MEEEKYRRIEDDVFSAEFYDMCATCGGWRSDYGTFRVFAWFRINKKNEGNFNDLSYEELKRSIINVKVKLLEMEEGICFNAENALNEENWIETYEMYKGQLYMLLARSGWLKLNVFLLKGLVEPKSIRWKYDGSYVEPRVLVELS